TSTVRPSLISPLKVFSKSPDGRRHRGEVISALTPMFCRHGRGVYSFPTLRTERSSTASTSRRRPEETVRESGFAVFNAGRRGSVFCSRPFSRSASLVSFEYFEVNVLSAGSARRSAPAPDD